MTTCDEALPPPRVHRVKRCSDATAPSAGRTQGGEKMKTGVLFFFQAEGFNWTAAATGSDVTVRCPVRTRSPGSRASGSPSSARSFLQGATADQSSQQGGPVMSSMMSPPGGGGAVPSPVLSQKQALPTWMPAPFFCVMVQLTGDRLATRAS